MNPGAIEEGVKTVDHVVGALSSTPMTLAMILTNVMLIVFLFYSQNQFYLQRQEVTKMLVEQQREVQILLSKCVVPGAKSEFDPGTPPG